MCIQVFLYDTQWHAHVQSFIISKSINQVVHRLACSHYVVRLAFERQVHTWNYCLLCMVVLCRGQSLFNVEYRWLQVSNTMLCSANARQNSVPIYTITAFNLKTVSSSRTNRLLREWPRLCVAHIRNILANFSTNQSLRYVNHWATVEQRSVIQVCVRKTVHWSVSERWIWFALSHEQVRWT